MRHCAYLKPIKAFNKLVSSAGKPKLPGRPRIHEAVEQIKLGVQVVGQRFGDLATEGEEVIEASGFGVLAGDAQGFGVGRLSTRVKHGHAKIGATLARTSSSTLCGTLSSIRPWREPISSARG